ncbi:MAG: RNA polymerase sigma factor, partial [Acidobacteriota bacterium]|nr:RNA polymerase sigma factor [Acidobacteriota bacterium]
PAEVDEVVQDAFLKAFTHLPSFREDLFFELWFTRILVNTCLDRLKARSRRARWLVPADARDSGLQDGPPSGEPSPEANLLTKERRVRLENAIEQLPLRQRTAIILSHFEGRPTREVSTIMGLNESTVRVHLFRAIRKLRGLLDRDSWIGQSRVAQPTRGA